MTRTCPNIPHPLLRLLHRVPLHLYREMEARLDGIEVDARADTAVILGAVPRVEAHSELDSNGDTVVAIFRGGRCVTVMLRRSSQPMTAKALRVSKVLRP